MKTRSILLHLPAGSYYQMMGTMEYAQAKRWTITLVEGDPPAYWKGDGAILTLRTANARLISFARKIAAQGIPVVNSGLQHAEIKVPRVTGDNREIGRLAAEHFSERHFRSVAWFSRDWSHVHALRESAFARAWKGDPPRALVWAKSAHRTRQYDTEALSAWLERELAALPRPVGIFAWNDRDAADLLAVSLAAGFSVPDEVAILGVDDNEIVCENQTVPLSSIAHDIKRISYERAALLDRIMEGEHPPEKPILIPPKGIVVRRSTDTIAATNPIVVAALKYMRENISRSFGSNQIADAIGISRSTLDRAFSAELGTSIAQEVLRQRIARAKVVLRRTDSSIAEIAATLGFCHGEHLSNTFRRIVGVTPGEYRRSPSHT